MTFNLSRIYGGKNLRLCFFVERNSILYTNAREIPSFKVGDFCLLGDNEALNKGEVIAMGWSG